MRLLRYLLVVASVALLEGQPARGAELLDDLLGTWAPDCSLGPSDANVHVAFQREGGDIVRSANGASVALLRSGTVDGSTVHLVFGIGDGAAMVVDADYAPDDSMRTVRSTLQRPGDPDATWIAGGVVLRTGQSAPTLHKCHRPERLSAISLPAPAV